jgi:hypothetical protein
VNNNINLSVTKTMARKRTELSEKTKQTAISKPKRRSRVSIHPDLPDLSREEIKVMNFLLSGNGVNFRLFQILWESPDDEVKDRLMELFGVSDEAALNDAIDRWFTNDKELNADRAT